MEKGFFKNQARDQSHNYTEQRKTYMPPNLLKYNIITVDILCDLFIMYIELII